ncbi:MAG: WhiB family transcriptional regulator [Propionibacteriaceae bacterium]|nr:WhiB family transcriptional regulator [Propionibacteriaceae bacterium]
MSRVPEASSDPKPTPDPQQIAGLVGFEYRSMVLRQLQITVEWQQIEWLDFAACRRSGVATRQTCIGCPVRAQCLAAALAVDDQAGWRGAVSRPEREDLWGQLEAAFLALRDKNFMHLDRLVDGLGIG